MDRIPAAKILRIIVYAVLVISAGTAFWFGDRLWAAARGGALPVWAALLPACAFTLFVILYAADRWLLVTRRGYPAGRAFFQVVFALLFLSLLLPQQASELQATRRSGMQADYGIRLLDSDEADGRAAACELLGLRGQAGVRERIAELARKDPSPLVRRACSQAEARLSEAR